MAGGIVLLSGGVGGAKLALGFAQAMDPAQLTLIANTGDDWLHLGLHISPDLDTLVYTLSGRANPATGWGVAGDTFEALDVAGSLGAPGWFRLGDRDLGLHLYRTERLRQGDGLAAITAHVAERFGVVPRILPMCEEPVPTMIGTDGGDLHLQEYLVRERCAPVVRAVRHDGIERAWPAPGVLDAIAEAEAIVFAPSNPLISIGPILAVPGLGEAIAAAGVPCIGVSPIVAGKALKGPLAKMLAELGHPVSAATVAEMWRPWLDVFVVDEVDGALVPQIEALGLRAHVLPTVMATDADKATLAAALLRIAEAAA